MFTLSLRPQIWKFHVLRSCCLDCQKIDNVIKEQEEKCSSFAIVYCHFFVMGALHINSLLAHLDDLKIMIGGSKIYVLLETKLDCSINGNEIYLPGFEVVRKD